MINAIKKNIDMILKILINQVGMDIFGIVLFMASATAGHSNSGTGHKMKILTSLFAIGFYMVLLYTLSKDEGLKDQIRIESGRIKRDNFRFLKVSLIANATNILLGVLMCIVQVVQMTGSTAANSMGAIAIFFITFTEGMYIGLLQAVFKMNGFACLAIVLPSIITCTIGYIAGTYGGFKNIPAITGKKSSSDSAFIDKNETDKTETDKTETK